MGILAVNNDSYAYPTQLSIDSYEYLINNDGCEYLTSNKSYAYLLTMIAIHT